MKIQTSIEHTKLHFIHILLWLIIYCIYGCTIEHSQRWQFYNPPIFVDPRILRTTWIYTHPHLNSLVYHLCIKNTDYCVTSFWIVQQLQRHCKYFRANHLLPFEPAISISTTDGKHFKRFLQKFKHRYYCRDILLDMNGHITLSLMI